MTKTPRRRRVREDGGPRNDEDSAAPERRGGGGSLQNTGVFVIARLGEGMHKSKSVPAKPKQTKHYHKPTKQHNKENQSI